MHRILSCPPTPHRLDTKTARTTAITTTITIIVSLVFLRARVVLVYDVRLKHISWKYLGTLVNELEGPRRGEYK